jgi:fused signal recognition particle receptor
MIVSRPYNPNKENSMNPGTPSFVDTLILYMTSVLHSIVRKSAEISEVIRNATGLDGRTQILVMGGLVIVLGLVFGVVKMRVKASLSCRGGVVDGVDAVDEVDGVDRESESPVSLVSENLGGQDGSEVGERPRAIVQEPVETGLLGNIRSGLAKTRKALSAGVERIFSGGSALNDDMLEELEEMLITSDVGVETSVKLIETLSQHRSEISSAEDLKRFIRSEIFKIIDIPPRSLSNTPHKPHVIMVVGVNGVGKTTTIGKLASRFVSDGKKVLIVAADTFRAAASEQLSVWADRSGADIVRHKDNSDPAAVAYDGIEAALSRQTDIVIIDTAGRLHTKKNLMEELKKIQRTVSSKIPDAPHDTLMVLDATTGQNALQQAKLFNEAIGITTIALTKLDGTAKGGIVIGICRTLNVPLSYVGVGEQIGDLQDFKPREFSEALL